MEPDAKSALQLGSDPIYELTEINHAGVSFNASGALVVPEGFLEPELIEKAHAAGDKVLLLLDGLAKAGLDVPGESETRPHAN